MQTSGKAMQSVVEFSKSLSYDDVCVVSPKTQLILQEAAEASKNPVITITSTLRTPERQARIMLDNLERGIRIRYAEPGRQVVAIYDARKKYESKEKVVSLMASEIKKLANQGKLVSRHCVTEEEYCIRRNIIDISTKIPNPRDMVKELLKYPDVAKIITPISSDYNDNRVIIDSQEPAIHIEINQ